MKNQRLQGFVSIAIGFLIDEGKLSLEDKIVKFSTQEGYSLDVGSKSHKGNKYECAASSAFADGKLI